MIDTIILVIPYGKYRIIDKERFKDTFNPINSKNDFQCTEFMRVSKGYKKYHQNPEHKYRDLGIVYPNLTISERLFRGEYSCNLKITFSCPKLLKGHSYWEVTNDNRQEILILLEKRLQNMGVIVPLMTLEKSAASTVHYCINIPFFSNEKIKVFLERLSKTSLGKRFENSTQRYSHDGMSFRFRTSVFEIIFYSKYHDALQPKSRCIDRRRTLQEVEIAKKLKKEGRIPPILRIEIRFNKPQTIRRHLKNVLGIDKQTWNYTELFDYEVSRKVLKHYWNKIISDPLNRHFLFQLSDKDLCLGIQAAYKGVKAKKIDAIVGEIFRLRTLGVKGLQEDTTKRQNRQAWDRKKKFLAKLLSKLKEPDDSLVQIITDAINDKSEVINLDQSSEQIPLL